MSVTPTGPDAAPQTDPGRLAEILRDILSSPAVDNGEAAAADEWITTRTLGPADSYHEAVLAAARYAFQAGQLQIVVPDSSPSPGLRLVQ